MKKLIAVLFSSVLGLAGAHAQDKGAGPTDAQIAAIVVTANSVDIDAGELARSKAQSKEVKAFAEQMITDHTAVNKQAAALAKKLNLTPEANETSKSLQEDGRKNAAHLKTLKGAEFDKAYVAREVTYHQQVLDAIDKTLLPHAKNAELKDLIAKVRPAIAAHLDHARQIQSSLGKF